MDVEIRACVPEDAVAAAPLIYSSGPAAFSYVFSHRTRIDAIEFLRRSLRREGGEFGYGNHCVAVMDGEIVGTGSCFSGKEVLGYTMAALGGILGNYGLVQGLGVIQRGLRIERVVRPPKGNVHYVGHLGVSPDVQSRGIGSHVVSHLLELGRAAGRSVAALDVSVENPRAEALYTRLGFRVTAEIVSRLSNSTATVPHHRRMELGLE